MKPPRYESARAKQAWADYLALGPGRSLDKLARLYEVRLSSGAGSVPTRHERVLEVWSATFHWPARLRAIADQEAAEAESRQRAYIREIMHTGFAQTHERVKALNTLALALYTDLGIERPDPHLWLRDVKGIGSGEDFERVDIQRFNADEVREFRAALTDLADEVGGRPKKTAITGGEGGPVRVTFTINQREPAPPQLPSGQDHDHSDTDADADFTEL